MQILKWIQQQADHKCNVHSMVRNLSNYVEYAKEIRTHWEYSPRASLRDVSTSPGPTINSPIANVGRKQCLEYQRQNEVEASGFYVVHLVTKVITSPMHVVILNGQTRHISLPYVLCLHLCFNERDNRRNYWSNFHVYCFYFSGHHQHYSPSPTTTTNTCIVM